jgi:CelD/BcsL family acetyltransferase involved in cellulose biosynthesis
MLSVREINAIGELASLRSDWEELLGKTPGATFFQSLAWLEIYWRHFNAGQQLRVLLVLEDARPAAIVPLVVRLEKSRVGRVRVLTYPLDNWGSFYGPIGADAAIALGAAMGHIRRTPRNWEMLELRWIGAPGTNPQQTQNALRAAGLQAYRTLWNQTAAADFSGGWDEYLAGRKGIWLRRMRQSHERLSRQGRVSYVRCRPEGSERGDGDPHWDLYDACEAIARQSWQSAATDGTTLSHESVRSFLREVHAAAAAAGTVDMNLLLLDDEPAAFIYGYHYQGYVYGLRRGFDAQRSRAGLGAVLLWLTLQDSAQRGDRIYDMGMGSLESKRHFQSRLLPIYRFSHFPAGVFRTQLLRISRWLKGRQIARNMPR